MPKQLIEKVNTLQAIIKIASFLNDQPGIIDHVVICGDTYSAMYAIRQLTKYSPNTEWRIFQPRNGFLFID